MKPTSRLTGLVCLSSICSLAIFLSAGCKTTRNCCWPREEAVPKFSEVSDAANRGDAKAQNGVGMILLHEKDYEEAMKWFTASADQGYAPAQHNLGMLNWRAQVPGQKYPNDAEALKWFMKAAEKNYPPSLTAIGHAYKKGRSVPQSYKEAMYWFRQSAAFNDAEAEYQLGVYYDAGHEFQANRTEAYKWFILAAAQGHCLAIKARDNIAGKLTREQIEEAQHRASVWMPKPASGGGQ